jgi:hypothetical protein
MTCTTYPVAPHNRVLRRPSKAGATEFIIVSRWHWGTGAIAISGP